VAELKRFRMIMNLSHLENTSILGGKSGKYREAVSFITQDLSLLQTTGYPSVLLDRENQVQNHIWHSQRVLKRNRVSMATLHGSDLQTSTSCPFSTTPILGSHSFRKKHRHPVFVGVTAIHDETSVPWSFAGTSSIPITVNSVLKILLGCCWRPPWHHLPWYLSSDEYDTEMPFQASNTIIAASA